MLIQAFRLQKLNTLVKFNVESELEVEDAKILCLDRRVGKNDPNAFAEHMKNNKILFIEARNSIPGVWRSLMEGVSRVESDVEV